MVTLLGPRNFFQTQDFLSNETSCQALRRLSPLRCHRPPSRRPLRSRTTSAPPLLLRKDAAEEGCSVAEKGGHSPSNELDNKSSDDDCEVVGKNHRQQQPSQQLQQQGRSNGGGYTITRHKTNNNYSYYVLYVDNICPFIPRVKTMLFLLNWIILVKAVIELLIPDGSK